MSEFPTPAPDTRSPAAASAAASDAARPGWVAARWAQAKAQLFRPTPGFVAAYLLGLLVLVLTWVAHLSSERVSVGALIRDPVQALNAPFFYGYVSNLGILVWAVTGGMCLTAWGALRRRNAGLSAAAPAQHDGCEWQRFFLLGALLSLILASDDVFLVHEELIPKFLFPRGSGFYVPEMAVIGSYGILALYFLWSCRRLILDRTPFAFLAVALACMTLSVAIAKLGIRMFVPDKQMRYLIEDGFKLLGIFGWAHYFGAAAITTLAPRSPAG